MRHDHVFGRLPCCRTKRFKVQAHIDVDSFPRGQPLKWVVSHPHRGALEQNTQAHRHQPPKHAPAANAGRDGKEAMATITSLWDGSNLLEVRRQCAAGVCLARQVCGKKRARWGCIASVEPCQNWRQEIRRCHLFKSLSQAFSTRGAGQVLRSFAAQAKTRRQTHTCVTLWSAHRLEAYKTQRPAEIHFKVDFISSQTAFPPA